MSSEKIVKPSARGKFITIEGSEGAGKSTAVHFIKQYLTEHQLPVVVTREPGGSPLAEDIRQLLLHPAAQEKMTPTAELLLMFAGRAQHLQSCIVPALNAGQWVVSDRYIDASYAYQCGGRGVSVDHVLYLDKWIVANFYPDLTLLMDIPADRGLLRAEKRGLQKDRIEDETLAFFIRVRQAYLKRAAQDPTRIKVIDASLDLPAVLTQIRSALDAFCLRNAP